MRTITRTPTVLAVLATVLMAGGMTSCKSKKKAAEKEAQKAPAGETLIKQYCSGPDFFSNEEFFRANNLGESMDQATAKKKAMANARADMASAIQTTMRGVIDNYVNSREMNNKEQVEERFEGLTREVLDQELKGTKTICEEVVKVNATGNFKYYVAIELSGQGLLTAYNERLSKDESMRIDYDYEQFKETFDKEMENLRNKN